MDLTVLGVGKILVGVLLALVLPGLALSYVTFPFHDRLGESSWRGLDWIERATLTILGSVVVTSGVVAVVAPRVAKTAGPYATRQLFIALALTTVLIALLVPLARYAYRRMGQR